MTDKIPKIRKNRILWLDLEMTGLSAKDDLILEVAMIVTDWQFKEIATYHGVIKNKDSTLAKRLATNASFWDQNPGTKKQLLDQNPGGKPLDIIENELLNFVNNYFKSDIPVLLAGNSIHIDRQFITAKWPKFDARLHYRMLDVTAWKVVFAGKYRTSFTKGGSHRALDDIRGSIAELQYYLAKIK